MNRLEAIKKIAKDAHEKNTIGASYFRNSVQGLAIIRILGIDNSNLKLQDDPVQIYLNKLGISIEETKKRIEDEEM